MRFKKKTKKPTIVIHSNYHPNNIGGIESVVSQLIKICMHFDVNLKCIFGSERSSISYKDSYGILMISRKILFKISGAPILNFGNFSLLFHARNASVLIFQEPFPFLWPAIFILKIFFHVQIILIVHADPVASSVVTKLYSFFRSFVFRGSICVSTSPNLMDKIADIKSSLKKVIPLGIPDSDLALLNAIKKTRYALYVGRLADYKGLKYLLLAAQKSKEVNYVIAGSGTESEMIESFILENEISNIKFLNRFISENEKLDLIANCAFLIFPSTSENEAFGLVQLEAMRSSKPVINTWLDSGVNFVAPDKLCAITVNKCDSDDLLRAVKFLWDNPIVANSLGINGRKRYLENFTEERFVNDWKKLLNKLDLISYHEK